VSFLNKVSALPATADAPAVAAGVLANLPAVFEYLSGDRYPDGTPRERSTMTTFVEEGCVKVCMSDRDQARTLWRSGKSLEDVLLALEVALQDGSADWRRAGVGKGKGPGKK